MNDAQIDRLTDRMGRQEQVLGDDRGGRAKKESSSSGHEPPRRTMTTRKQREKARRERRKRRKDAKKREAADSHSSDKEPKESSSESEDEEGWVAALAQTAEDECRPNKDAMIEVLREYQEADVGLKKRKQRAAPGVLYDL